MPRLMAGLVCSLMVVAGAAATGQEATAGRSLVEVRGQGLLVFTEHCASCHGRTGRGDGPKADELSVRPTDLTRLAERNGRVFPAATVSRVIDGADRAHRAGDMPLWGQAFRSDPALKSDAAVKQRIEALTLYLEFIQARPRR